MPGDRINSGAGAAALGHKGYFCGRFMKGRRIRTLGGLVVVVLLTVALLPMRHPQLVDSLNDGRLLEAWYDGYKSYAVMEYHIAHDSSYQWSSAMNYPYGEHIVPAAAHPFFSNALKLLHEWGWSTADRLPVLLHGWLLLGWIAAAGLLYMVLRGLSLPVPYAVAVALVLVHLNPQTERLYAHFGLAQFYALPLVLYGLQRFEYRRSWVSAALLLLGIAWLSGIHFYYFAILNLAVGGYFLFSWLEAPTRARGRTYATRLALIVLPPLLGFYWWIYLDDPVTDRGGTPWGFLVYRAQWESILLARDLAHWQWFESMFTKIRHTSHEGRAYVGFPAAVLSLYLLLRWVFHFFQKNKTTLLRRLVPDAPVATHRYLRALLHTGVLALLVAMAFPFNLPGMETFVDYAGPLRQFRSLGRFAWIFYYAINVYAAYLLYHWLRQFSKPVFWAGTALLFAVWTYECIAFARFFDFRTDQVKERRAGQAFTDFPGIDYERYQAIVPVPNFNVGAAAFGGTSGGFSVQKALTASVQTGLPTTGAMLTRTSIGQTFRQQQLVSEPYRLPTILTDYPSDKPLLLTYFREMTDLDRYRYDHLLEGADSLYADGGLALYELPLRSFADRIATRRRRAAAALQDTTLTLRNGWLTADSSAVIGYRAFDEEEASGYRGKGYTGSWEQPVTLTMPLPDGLAGGRYRSTFWLHVRPAERSTAILRLEEWRAEERLHAHTFKASDRFQVFDPTGWVLVDFAFEADARTRELRLAVDYPDLDAGTFVLDEWLVYPADAELYRRDGDRPVWNNRYYE